MIEGLTNWDMFTLFLLILSIASVPAILIYMLQKWANKEEKIESNQ